MVSRGIFHITGTLSIIVAALLLPKTALLISLGVITILFLSFELLRLVVSAVNYAFEDYKRGYFTLIKITISLSISLTFGTNSLLITRLSNIKVRCIPR